MQCRTHPTTSAYNTCNQCGDWLCEECTVDVQGRLFCRGCLMKLAAPEADGHPVPPARPAGRQISWGLLFLFSFFFPSGVNYMFMGLIKRGLAAMCGFFLIIYLINISNMPLTLLLALALPVYVLTCIFDGFNIRRRINAGETVGDNIDEAINFMRRNKYAGWIIIAILSINLVVSVVGIFFSLIRWLMPALIIACGVYLLLKHNKKPPGPSA